MFGLGKIFDGVFGKFFDSIGMGWMTQALSLTANIMSGNWAAAAKDVFDLVARFSNSEWMNRVSSLAPLGGFDASGCFGQDFLSESTLGSWLEQLGSSSSGNGDGFENFTGAIYTLYETVQNYSIANANLQYAQMNNHA